MRKNIMALWVGWIVTAMGPSLSFMSWIMAVEIFQGIPETSNHMIRFLKISSPGLETPTGPKRLIPPQERVIVDI